MGILDKFKDEEENDVERHEPRDDVATDLPDTDELETGEAREPGHEDERRERRQEFDDTAKQPPRRDLDMTSEELREEENKARTQPPPPPPDETRPELPQRKEQRRQRPQQQQQQNQQPQRQGQRRDLQEEATRTQPAEERSPQPEEDFSTANPHTQGVDASNPMEKTDKLSEPPAADELERRGERDRPTEDLAERFESASYTGQESVANTSRPQQQQRRQGGESRQPGREPEPGAPPNNQSPPQSTPSNQELQRQLGRVIEQNDTVIELLRRIAKSLSRERRSKHIERHRSL